MHQKNFVICDKEADYARNLMQMIGSRKELGFQMHMFQKLEPLKQFAEQKSIQVLLIGEEYLAEERMQIPAVEKFVLVKEEGRILENEEKELYKYQSVDQILTKVLEFSLNDQSTLPKARKKTRGSMIGVYSPVHRIGKTKYALELGKEMAQKGPVLYLNLEESFILCKTGGWKYRTSDQYDDKSDGEFGLYPSDPSSTGSAGRFKRRVDAAI